MTDQSMPLTEAMSSLMAQHPFFATLLYRLVPQGVEEVMTDAVPTAATNGERIMVNPKWFNKLSLEERRFVLAHEIMHVVFDHPNRGKLYDERGFGPDLKPWSHKRYNIAADYVINDLLANANVGKMPHGGMHRPDVTDEDLVDEVYCDVPEDEDDSENWDKHMPGEGGTPRTEDEVKSAVAAASNVAKMQGDLPAGLERWVKGLLMPQIPWQEKLRNFVIAATGHDSNTWNRPNRRRLAMSPHIYMPGTTGFNCGPVAVVIDTSGSVSDDELRAFRTEVAGIMADARPEVLHVLWTDAKVAGHDELGPDDAEEIENLKPKGGGGTDMTAAFQYIDEHDIRIDQAIVLTDGYTPFGEQTPYPTIWVSTSDQKSPWGETIKLEV